MDTQTVMVTLLGIVLSGVAWWVKNIWSMVTAQQAMIVTLQVELAKNYAPRAELEKQFDRINEKLDKIVADVRRA
jgi:hypothetical protein